MLLGYSACCVSSKGQRSPCQTPDTTTEPPPTHPCQEPSVPPGQTVLKPNNRCPSFCHGQRTGPVCRKKIPRILETGQCHQPYLNCLVESGTEVSEYLEAFIQLHGFFVFTEKIYKGMSLDLQLVSRVPARPTFPQQTTGKQTGTSGKQGQLRWTHYQGLISGLWKGKAAQSQKENESTPTEQGEQGGLLPETQRPQNKLKKPGRACTPAIPAFGRWRLRDEEFKARWVTHRDPVSK